MPPALRGRLGGSMHKAQGDTGGVALPGAGAKRQYNKKQTRRKSVDEADEDEDPDDPDYR